MATHLEINQIDESVMYEKTTKRLLNKALISDVHDDSSHDQTIIIYQGEEIKARNNYEEIRAALLE